VRIVQIIPSFNVGGGELLAVRLAAEIKRQQPDFDVYILSLYDAIPTVVYDEALASGAQVVTLGKKKGFDPAIFRKIFKFLFAVKPDVIHTHLAGLRYALAPSVFFPESRRIHTIHNVAHHEVSAVVGWIHKLAFKVLGWMPVALSKMIQDSIVDFYGIKPPIVDNGIACHHSVFGFDRLELRSRLGFSADDILLITIGRLDKQKNQALLMDAFAKVLNVRPDAKLLIVGDDPTNGAYKSLLMDKASCLPPGIKQAIHFLGPRKDVAMLLRASDVFVISSDWEGVPLVLLEAMAYRVPIVSTAVGGIPDVISQEINGILVEKGDIDGLAAAIIRVLSNDLLAETLVVNAADTFKQCYSIDNTARNYLALYDKVRSS